MLRRLAKWFGVLLLILVAVVLGLRYYLTIKPVEYPINLDASWDSGPLIHILPTVNHERILVKTSFKAPLAAPPILEIDGRQKIAGTPIPKGDSGNSMLRVLNRIPNTGWF